MAVRNIQHAARACESPQRRLPHEAGGRGEHARLLDVRQGNNSARLPRAEAGTA